MGGDELEKIDLGEVGVYEDALEKIGLLVVVW